MKQLKTEQLNTLGHFLKKRKIIINLKEYVISRTIIIMMINDDEKKIYLNKIEPYLRKIIIGLQNSDTWKIQLTIATNFISSEMQKKSI